MPAALRQAAEHGLDIDLDETSYYVNHVSLIPTGERTLPRWRAKLFAVLHQNSAPAARYFRIPPDRVLEVGVYVTM